MNEHLESPEWLCVNCSGCSYPIEVDDNSHLKDYYCDKCVKLEDEVGEEVL